MTKTTLTLSYLRDRAEKHETLAVSDAELATLAATGREMVEDRGEYDEAEIADMSDEDLAAMAASAERGDEAYSLACAKGW